MHRRITRAVRTYRRWAQQRHAAALAHPSQEEAEATPEAFLADCDALLARLRHDAGATDAHVGGYALAWIPALPGGERWAWYAATVGHGDRRERRGFALSARHAAHAAHAAVHAMHQEIHEAVLP